VASRHRGRSRSRRRDHPRCRFDRIPTISLPRLSTISKPARDALQRRVPQARRALAVRGMNEVVTWSFLPLKKAERFGGGGCRPAAAEFDRCDASTPCGRRSCPT